jgi:hypothetical protein
LPTLAIKEQLNNLAIILSSSLRIDGAKIDLEYVNCDLESFKFSPKYSEYKQYFFKFFKVKIRDDKFLPRRESLEFDIDGCQYFWKSINELASDKETNINNNDVISHIKHNLVVFTSD